MSVKSRLMLIGMTCGLVLQACTSTLTPGATATLSPTPRPPTETPTATVRPSLGIPAAALQGVSVQIWHAFAGDSEQVFSEQASLFNATNEWGISVVPTGYGDHLGLFEAMQAAIESGETPQMVAALPEQVLGWDADGLVVGLEAYLADLDYGMEAAELADIPQAFWVQDEAGRWLGLPAERSARTLFYNQTWAHELGFTSPPGTPEDFQTQACAANAAFKTDNDLQNDGYGGWVVDSDWQSAYAWVLALGGSVWDGEAYTFRTDDNQQALGFLKGLYDDSCAWLSIEETPFGAFAERKALFVSADLADVALAAQVMNQAGNADEWTLTPFPGVETPLAVAYGPNYTVLKSSPEEQLAAWLFARWMLRPERQALWVEATGLLPLRNSVLEMVAPYSNASPQWAAAAGEIGQLRGVPASASWRKVRYVLEDGMKYIFQVNVALNDLPGVLDEMQAMAEEFGNE